MTRCKSPNRQPSSPPTAVRRPNRRENWDSQDKKSQRKSPAVGNLLIEQIENMGLSITATIDLTKTQCNNKKRKQLNYTKQKYFSPCHPFNFNDRKVPCRFKKEVDP